MNKTLLHIEGFAVLALSLHFYGYSGFSWLLFFILFLAPDLSMLAYLMNNRMGAIVYNLFHTYSLAIVILFWGIMVSDDTVLAIGLIWSAHIGMDRMLGFGLKYPTAFKDTHLNRV